MASPSSRQGLMQRLEQITRTDVRYILSGGSWLTAGQVGIAFIAFLSSLAFARYVPKDAFGTYRFLISLFWTLSSFGLTGIPTALSRAVAQGKDASYWLALRLSFIGSIPLIVGSAIMAVYYAVHGNSLLVAGTVIIGLIGPGMQASYLYGAFLEGKKSFRMNAISGLILNAVPFVLLLGAMVVSKSSLVFLSVYLGGSVATATLISLYVIRSFSPIQGTIDKREFTSYGGHLSLMNVLFGLSQQADKLLVFHALGAVDLALYSFAVSIPEQIKAVLGNLETLSLPRFVNRPIKEVLSTLIPRLGGLTILIVCVVAAYILAAPYVFHVFFPAYADSVRISQIYALSLIPMGSIVPVSLLQAHAAKRELYVYNTSVPIIQIGTLLIGVHAAGLLGAVIARIVTRVATLLISLVLVYSNAKRQPSRV